MQDLLFGFALVGAIVLVVGAFSRPLSGAGISLPLAALIIGVAAGPLLLGWLQPQRWPTPERLLEEVARASLALGVMGVALRLPRSYVNRHWRSLLPLLAIGMPAMWLASAAVAWSMLDVTLLGALLIGAVLTPTDPIVASTIVTGRLAHAHLPARVRRLLSAESGANDGLAWPLLMLPLLLLAQPAATAWADWGLQVLLWEVGGAVLLGGTLGAAAGWLLRWAEDHRDMERESFLAYTLGLTILALGAARLLQVEAIVAVFVSGLAFARLARARDRAEEENIQEALNRFFATPVFVLLGAMLPWQQWSAHGWLLCGFALAVLLLRRLPAWLLLRAAVPQMRSWREAWFLGWFGPLGVAAILYGLHAQRETGDTQVWAVTSFCLVSSVLVHSLSAAPATRAFGPAHRPPRQSGGSTSDSR